VAEEEEVGGSGLAALNLVGILAAGGLAGYLTIQKKEAQESEEQLQQKLQSGERCTAWVGVEVLHASLAPSP
jgi:hypothetical protein